MPKRKTTETEPFKKVMFYIPEKLVDEFDQLLLNPVTNKPVYGKKSEIVTKLLTSYVRAAKERQKGKTNE